MDTSTTRRVVRRLRLTARIPVGTGMVGCSGAVTEETSGRAEAALDVVEPDGSAETIIVNAGEEFDLGGLAVRVDEVHPWDPPRAAGVVLSWESAGETEG